MVQKFYAIDNEASIKKGTIISTLFAMVIAGGSYFLGGFGRLFSDQVNIASDGYDAVVPAMLSNLSPILIALAVILYSLPPCPRSLPWLWHPVPP